MSSGRLICWILVGGVKSMPGRLRRNAIGALYQFSRPVRRARPSA